MTATVVAMRGISKGFATGDGDTDWVLRDFDFSVAAGESVALWGPSGSGKTTILNLLAGLIDADAGRVIYFPDAPEAQDMKAADVDGAAALRRAHLGYIFQFFNLIETLTAAENVRLGLELAGRSDADVAAADAADEDVVSAALAQVGLAARAGHFPAELSGGEQQRVAVLRALIHQPRVVLADEPTGNLDKVHSEQVAELLFAQSARQSAALVVATHSEAVARRADRVLELG